MMTRTARPAPIRSSRKGGFTLMEMVITVAIIGILAAIAYPSYQSYLIKARRASAQSYLMDLAQAQQRFLLDARAYTTTETTLSPGGTPADIASFYDIVIAAPAGNPPTFLLTAKAKGKQLSDGDLTIDNLGVKTPTGKW